MGNRTVVILYNDHASDWMADPELGRKIYLGMNDAQGIREPNPISAANLHYGKVVQCAHADDRTLAILDGYSLIPIAHGFWHPGATSLNEMTEDLLRNWADQNGFRLVRKKQKKD